MKRVFLNWKSTLLLIISIGVVGCIGVFFEEGASATRVVTFKGIFSEPATDWPLTQIFIGHVYGLLYSMVQTVPWYGVIDYCLVLSGVFLLYRLLGGESAPWIAVAGFALLSVDDLVMFSFTRTAMLVISGGLLSLYLLRSKKYRLVTIIGLVTVVVLGFCSRPQAFAYVSALTGLFVLTHLLITRKWKGAILGLKLTAVPIIICSVLIGVYLTAMPPDIRESQRLAPRFYNLFGGGFYDDISTLSKGDSLAIRLLQGNFVNDRNVFNEEFTERVTRNTPREYFSVSKLLSPKLLQRSVIKYGDFFYRHHVPDLIVLTSMLIWLLVAFFKNRDVRYFWIACFLITSLLSLLFITLIVKMELRISSPLFLFAFVSVWVLLKEIGVQPEPKRWVGTLILLLISGGFIYNSVRLHEASDKYHRFVAENIKITQAVNTRFNNHTIVVSNPGLRLFSRLPFSEFNTAGTNSYKSYEGEAIIYMPTMQRMIEGFSGSLEMVDFFDAMFQKQDRVIYLANDKWVALICAYLEHHYGIRYEFEKISDDNLDNMVTYRPLAFYRLNNRIDISRD